MPFEIKVIAEPGSATQCGQCSGSAHAADESVICVLFKHQELKWTWRNPDEYEGGDYGRLPECVEAEKRAVLAAEKGASE